MIGRLKSFVKKLSLTDRAFAQKCGIAKNTLSYYLAGQRKPSYEAIEKVLLAFPDLSAEWLIRGTGEMMLSQPAQSAQNIETLERMNKMLDTITTLQDVINTKEATIKALLEENRQLKAQVK